METVLDFLFKVVPNWKAETWFGFAVAIAVTTQAYIAYRLWRPKLEVFTQLSIPPMKVAPGRAAYLEIANLSPTGIWVDSMSIVARELIAEAPVLNKPVKILIPAFCNKSIRCDQAIYEAFLGTGHGDGPYVGQIKVRVRYRVHAQWRYTKWQRYQVTATKEGLTRLPDLPVTSLRSQIGTFASKVRRYFSRSK